MKRIVLHPVVLLLVMAAAVWAGSDSPSIPTPVASEDAIQVFFSPGGHCTDAIVNQISSAKRSILVQAYSFTSAPIAKALVDAHDRKVDITVVLDSSQRTAQYSSATFLFNQGIPVFIDSGHAIAHNKVILIDERTIITGSFNFSKAAEESNAENLLIIDGKPKLYQAYAKNFQDHLNHSIKYEGRETLQPAVQPPHEESTQSPAPPTTQAEITVHVTKSGKKYHSAGCRFLSKSDEAIPVSQAIARGLTPCSACNPPAGPQSIATDKSHSQ